MKPQLAPADLRHDAPTHDEWLDYMAALKRYDAGRAAAGDRDMIARFSERAARAGTEHAAVYFALA
jgi:hypothetical protein